MEILDNKDNQRQFALLVLRLLTESSLVANENRYEMA
jgi:hypothetical protein